MHRARALLSLAQVLSAWMVLVHVIPLPACDCRSLPASQHELTSTTVLTVRYGMKEGPWARVGNTLVMEARILGSTQFHTLPTCGTWGR